MIHTILIANRGEIASRIIRTCQKMGIRSVAVFSDADRNAPFVKEASTAIHIGESNPTQSYLDMDKIITAAKATGADAIHPGYGFLSENTTFAQKCKKAGIIFIGPHPEAIEAMGSKSKAKALMEKHKVPTIPGYKGSDQSDSKLQEEAEKIGYPLLLKATAGGGGKGMRIVHKKSELKKAIESAKREALNAFGDDELIVEKYIESGRHIEFQIFGDQYGNAIHILERECSIQRRYQKVIEESPSPILDEALRKKMGSAAVKAAKALNYDNAGTVEFILDEKSKKFYFLEVNTRLQVEHPVTEEITGLDLVQLQIEVAQGKKLSITQKDVQGKGYALEVRLYAEDASNNFLPVTGKIIDFKIPQVEGLRVESAIESGSEISVFYDPMIAKIIVWGEDRGTAIRKMRFALQNLICTGTTTNQNFLLKILENPDFIAGKYDTHFLDKQFDYSKLHTNDAQSVHLSSIAATLYQWKQREEQRSMLRALPSGWRNSFYEHQKENYTFQEADLEVKYRFQNNHFQFILEEKEYTIYVVSQNTDSITLQSEGIQYHFHISQNQNNFYTHNEQFGNLHFTLKDRFPIKEQAQVKGGYKAPMPSQIIKLLVNEGDKVKAGDGLIVLSSMKMENTICAETAGVVEEIYTAEGSNVEADFLLLKLNEN